MSRPSTVGAEYVSAVEVKGSRGSPGQGKSSTTGSGYFPQENTWNFGAITQLETEKLLLQPGLRSGTFLVRSSTTQAGHHALCVRDGSKIVRYLIKKDRETGFCLGKICFLKMEDLISHFKTSSDVLCCRLTDVCPKLRSFTSELSVSEIDRSAIQLNTKLSSSHGEEVWVGVWEFKKKETTPVLVRKLSQLLYSKSDITREVEIVRKLRHENIIQFYGVSTRPELLCIVSESMENGNLLCILREGKDHCGIKSFAEKIKIAIQIACGMDYLQSQKCVLCNMAAENVFVDGRNIAKITNFQNAKTLLAESSELASPIDQFLYRWSPPEVMLYGIHSLKSDIWSLGIVIAEIITNGREPYSEIRNIDEVRVQVVEKHYVMPQDQLYGCPDSLYEVLLSCWRYDASCRPTVEFIITGLQDCVPLEKSRSN